MPSFKHAEGARYHGGAILYALFAYGFGWAGLFVSSWPVNFAGTLLLAHGMTIAAYLVHECGHNIVFRENADNARLGGFMNWICGGAYGTYEDVRYTHFRHHVDVDDVTSFDYDRFFREHPRVFRATQILEWAYIPAHDLLMHAYLALNAFLIPQRRHQRLRNAAVLLVRGGLYLALLFFFPKAALLYALAYMLMMTVLRFMDGLQHDYGYHLTLFSDEPPPHKGDLPFEQEHTFSNPHSFRHEHLNWFTLNFGFHNAHHAKPITPWWRLPTVHRELFGDDPSRVIPLWPQLLSFHRYRVSRIEEGAQGDFPLGAGEEFLRTARAGQAPGGNAASFLTSF